MSFPSGPRHAGDRTMYNPLLLPELREMLSTGDEQGLSDVLTELHPATIADFSEGLSVEETWKLLFLQEGALEACQDHQSQHNDLIHGRGESRIQHAECRHGH
jgi:hypothetical protein